MKPKTHKLLSILLALVLLCSLAGPLALSARAAGPYNVGLDDIFNGSVTVDKTAAEEGEAVSFTATPAEGYALASVSVYAIDLGQSVEVNWNAETGGFVFLMPASQVQISASFKAPATFTVTFDPNGGTGTMAAQSITEEETWTIPDCEFTPPGGKVFDSWLISPVSGSQPHFPRVGNPGSGLSFGLDHGFDMIAQAQWKDAPATTYTITVNGGKAYKAGGVEITGAAAGDFVYILFDDDAAPAGKYIEWGSAVTEPAALLSAGMISGTEYQAGFIMPAANITVSPDYLDQKSLTVDLTGGTSTDTSAASNAVWSLYRAEDLGLITADISDSHQEKFDLDKDGSWDVTYSTNDSEFSVQDSCSVTGDKTLTIPAAEYSPVTFKFPVPAAATCTVTLIAYDKTNATEKAGGEVAFSDSGKGTTISGDYQENSSRTVGVYPASDYTFTGWAKGSPSGEIVSTASPYTFTVTEDVTLYALFEKVTAYPVWVGSTQVTSANKDDILGDGGKAKYDPTSKTLTLDNPSITTTHGGDAICTESGDLTIKGTATLSASVFSRADLTIDADLTCTRLFSYNDTVIKGGEIKVTAGSGSGIECHAGTLKISGGNVTVTSTGSYGVNTGVKITGGTVNITGKTNGIYTSNYAGNECVNITGGTVTITGTDGDGIYSPSGGVTVSGEDTEVTVNGQTYAVKLKNDLTVSDPLAIVEPEGGEVSTITEDSKTYNVVVSGETPAKTVVIKKAGPTVTTYPVWVGGVQVTSANKDDILGDGGKAKYDPDSKTLTLDNPTVSGAYSNAAVYAEVDLTIKGSATLSKIILVKEKDLTLDANIEISTPGRDSAIVAGNITVNGGSINASADEDALFATSSIAINAGSVVGNGCDLYAESITIANGTVNVSGLDGIYSKNDITISGGTVTAKGDEDGINAGGSVTISGGTITATGGNYGITAKYAVSVSAGTVTAAATMTDSNYYSALHGESVTITGGTVSAKTASGKAIYAYSGNVEISADVTAVSEAGSAVEAWYGDIVLSGGTIIAQGTTRALDADNYTRINNGITKVTLDGDPAVYEAGSDSVLIGDALIIEEPEGGTLDNDKTTILESDGTTKAKHVVIVPGTVVTTYPVWVGGVQVTDANKDDILGDGTASFDPSTNTLTLDGLNVGDGYHASGASIVSTGIDLTVKGSATLSGGGYGIYVIETTEGGGNLTLDGAAITYAVASGSDTGIRADGNISISGGTIDVTAAKNGIYAGGSVTISGSVTATGSECGISAAHGDVTISGGTVTAKSDTVGIEATNGTIKIQNGTTSVTADGAGAAIGAGGITIGDEMMIKEPAGGFVGDITGSRVIKNPDDTTATHAVIVPKEAEKFPVEVVITTHDKDGNVISTVGGTATADKTEVAKGDTITVTVTPNPGFELESIEFSDGVTGGYQAGKETSSTVPNDFTTSTGKLQIDVLFKETAPATTHTVTFDANGHGTAPAAQTVNSGETATEPTAPTESGWTFGGWYTEAACTTAFDFSTAITGDITLYAKWTEESVTPPVPTTYTVTFEVNGGSAVAAQTVNDGEKATKPADPTKSGFVFDGWYADATFSVAFDFSAPITADVTVYAKWKEEAAPGEIVYTIVSGGSSTWTKGSSSGVTIVVKRDPNDEECFSHFASVQIGSTTLASGTDYTAVAGSTVITLNTSALQKLSTGTKTVTINFDDGKATTSLIIKAGSSGISGGTSPKTGDNSNPGLWITVMVLSGLGLGGLVVTDKKRRYVSRH